MKILLLLLLLPSHTPKTGDVEQRTEKTFPGLTHLALSFHFQATKTFLSFFLSVSMGLLCLSTHSLLYFYSHHHFPSWVFNLIICSHAKQCLLLCCVGALDHMPITTILGLLDCFQPTNGLLRRSKNREYLMRPKRCVEYQKNLERESVRLGATNFLAQRLNFWILFGGRGTVPCFGTRNILVHYHYKYHFIYINWAKPK